MTDSNFSNQGFVRRDNELWCEGISLAEIASRTNTPAYVYSKAQITRNFLAYANALTNTPHLICYAMKANSTAGILQILAKLGAGADTVSGGEIARALRAGFSPEKIVYSGVGKTVTEIAYALEKGIGCFNVESEPELELINETAIQKGMRAPVSIRCNPNVDAKTHPYISTGLKNNKFGIPIERVESLYLRAAQMPGINIKGIDAHIGSQITEIAPYLDSVSKLLDVMSALRQKGLEFHHLDIGGGLGIRYCEEDLPPSPQELLTAIRHLMVQKGFEKTTLIVEPGRSIIGNAGVMLTKVLFIKKGDARDFCIVDAAMTDLIRPALYSAWMNIEPVVLRQQVKPMTMDVVGPVCESSDFLGRSRNLAVLPGDALAVMDAGAYGASMASRYNSRLLPMEYLVDDDRLIPLRRPDTFDSMIEDDLLLD